VQPVSVPAGGGAVFEAGQSRPAHAFLGSWSSRADVNALRSRHIYFTLYIVLPREQKAMRGEDFELLQGTLGIVILKALLSQSMHGYGIARWVEAMTDDVLRIEEGSLYPALRRLEDRGFVDAEWGISDHNRRAKFYVITRVGRAHLRAEATRWLSYSSAVTRVLRVAPALT